MGVRESILIVFLFFGQNASYSQVQKNSHATYKSLPELLFLTNDSLQDKIGAYKLGKPLWGLVLNLDSTLHFQIRTYSCLGGGIVDSGIWFVIKTGRIGLRSKSGIQTFDLLKFDHFCFCIPPNKRVSFIDDFLKLRRKFKAIKPTHFGDLVITANDIVAYQFKEKYYLRDLDDL
jgi:hypothetical protein